LAVLCHACHRLHHKEYGPSASKAVRQTGHAAQAIAASAAVDELTVSAIRKAWPSAKLETLL
jgi:hypothetical protein